MDNLSRSNVLVVGAGGIGCELLKNLVMWHFTKITVVDLDTIDVSNLNRQFLFRKEHVGKSKALTAKESVLVFNPNVEIDARHDDIMSEKYNSDFFKSFDVVLNALDNRTARNYVNRQCVKAGIPLIESGTTGYRGQVQVIRQGQTACYECHPKPAQKQYPACTIRNTPSEPIHCVVWAKFLFNQLFGEPDADEDVVPDQNDPELAATAVANGDSEPSARVSVRSSWVSAEGECDPSLLLRVLFVESITSLLSMASLWADREDRVRPEVLSEACVTAEEAGAEQYVSAVTGGVRDGEAMPVEAWCQVFKRAARALYGRLGAAGQDGTLCWDKDDVVAMDFVAAASNIRMSVFHMKPLHTRFDLKSMAGNIIPAIATTNAVVAGVMVLQAYKVINGRARECLDVLVSDLVSCRGKVVQAVSPLTPVSTCIVCCPKQTLTLTYGTLSTVTLAVLKRAVLQDLLGMRAPNVGVGHSAKVLIDGGEDEEDEDEAYLAQGLDRFELKSGSVLRCNDYLREEYEVEVELREDASVLGYALVGDVAAVKASARDETVATVESAEPVARKRKIDSDEAEAEEPVPRKMAKGDAGEALVLEDDDDLIMVS